MVPISSEFLFIPFLALPFIGGSSTPTPLSGAKTDGFNCWLGKEPDCVCNNFWIHFPKDPSNVGSSPAVKGTAPRAAAAFNSTLYANQFSVHGAGLVMTSMEVQFCVTLVTRFYR